MYVSLMQNKWAQMDTVNSECMNIPDIVIRQIFVMQIAYTYTHDNQFLIFLMLAIFIFQLISNVTDLHILQRFSYQ